ncbi:MAG TPA: hypothetical protein VK524_05305 [Polyangiaceae bacterium]|nr:hypothetical protein [Polyangiaceae bacterium]
MPFETQYRKNAATCYASTLRITGGPFEIHHSNGTQPIAVSSFTRSNVSVRSTWCGPYTSASGLDPAQSYTEKVAALDCAAWQRQYLDATNCRSEAPGSCAAF